MPLEIGVMLRGQVPIGVDPERGVEHLLAQARLADRLGYASITTGSHYSTPEQQNLQQLPILARLTGEVTRARLNAGVVLVPLHKPLDIAEQLATLDVLSGGRMIFGVGLGYRPVELLAFGTSMADRGRRATESLIAIRRLWTEDEVSMVGSHFVLDGAVCQPKPVQRPHPPIWVGASATAALRRAVDHGSCWYLSPHPTITTLEQQMDDYRRLLDEAGKPFPAELPMRREAFVASTRAEAIRLAAPHLARKYASYRAWGQEEQLPPGESLQGDLEQLAAERFLIGSVDEVAEQMIAINDRLGVNHLVLSMEWAGMEASVARDGMTLMAEAVLPQVAAAT